MYILVTGGAGFIGSHLAERLAEAGHEVVIYDVFSKLYPAAVKRRNVANALSLAGCSLIEGDLLDEQRLDSVFSPKFFDAVYHLAGWPGARASVRDARAFARNNITATMNLLEACRRHKVRRIVFASSAAVYGLRREGPLKETDPTDRPISPYGATKKSAEILCHMYCHIEGFAVRCLRLFEVYGPRVRPDQRLAEFARALAVGGPVKVAGDGSAVRDWIYVDDVVGAFVKALDGPAGFEAINIGSGTGVALRETAERLGAAMGSGCVIESAEAGESDQPYAVADVSKAERVLGWRPTVDLDEGLRRFAKWFRAEEFEDEA